MRTTTKFRLLLSIYLMETLITMQYSTIITAANDLVGGRAPMGLVLFAYSVPSILTRVIVPLSSFRDFDNIRFISRLIGRDPSDFASREFSATISLSREVNYPLRLLVCAVSSFLGLQLLSIFSNIPTRVLGIMLAALSSNLGDMSFQMLCARYPKASKWAFFGYTTGSGTAAVIGASYYTFVTSWMQWNYGWALSIVGVAPVLGGLCYAFILPDPEDDVMLPNIKDQEKEGIVQLPWKDKLRIIRPMFVPYMLPLATIFFLEHCTTQGIFPTLLYYLPLDLHSFRFAKFFNRIFTESREFYPFYLTVNQAANLIGRCSIIFSPLPGGKTRSTACYWTLTVVEGLVLAIQGANSVSMTSSLTTTTLYGPAGVLLLTFLGGASAGIVFCNTYWKVMKLPLPPAVYKALDAARVRAGVAVTQGEEGIRLLDDIAPTLRERSATEDMALREFLLSAVAPPDVASVTIASLVGMGLQRGLCAWQVMNGRELCLRPVSGE